jgi:hypothetical protein
MTPKIREDSADVINPDCCDIKIKVKHSHRRISKREKPVDMYGEGKLKQIKGHFRNNSKVLQ